MALSQLNLLYNNNERKLKKSSLKDYETVYMPSTIMVLKSMKELLKT